MERVFPSTLLQGYVYGWTDFWMSPKLDDTILRACVYLFIVYSSQMLLISLSFDQLFRVLSSVQVVRVLSWPPFYPA